MNKDLTNTLLTIMFPVILEIPFYFLVELENNSTEPLGTLLIIPYIFFATLAVFITLLIIIKKYKILTAIVFLIIMPIILTIEQGLLLSLFEFLHLFRFD